MKKGAIVVLMLFVAMAVFSSNVKAQEKPVQLSLFNPIQLFPQETSITGLRFNLLYGRNVSVVGLDLGLVNHNTGGVSKGLQYGVVGYVEADFVGWQDNIVNITRGSVEGLQLGFVNHADFANGLQLGFVNYARTMKGLQIGLINIISQGGQFPIFPIVNWSF